MFNHHGVYRLHEAANTSLPQRRQRSAHHISKADGRRDCGKYGGYYKVSEALQRDRNYCTADPCVIRSTACAQKPLPLPFNETEWNGSFRSRLIIFRYPFWIRFNLFPCCAICFSTWQFTILIKERACMLFNWKNGFQRLHQKRILFYHAKGSHTRSHHTHARSHHAHAQSHTSLRTFCSCSFRLSRSTVYRSWLQHWIALNF